MHLHWNSVFLQNQCLYRHAEWQYLSTVIFCCCFFFFLRLFVYLSGLIKFFGCVARLHPKEVFNTNKTFVNTVFNNLTNPESETLHSLSVQTVGFIGSSVEGKLALEKLGTYIAKQLKFRAKSKMDL